MKILLTGSEGFIGKNAQVLLKRNGYELFCYDRDSNTEQLKQYIANCDFVIHLAGINRPLTEQEFFDGNTNFTKYLLDLIVESKRDIPIIFSSSIQASLDNPYGKSKKMAEDLILNSGLRTYVFRLANVFGKWCRPNYNSAAATFCYNIAHNLPIEIRDREYIVHYNYVDDIINTFIECVKGSIKPSKDILYINPTYDCSLGNLADLLYKYKQCIESDIHLPLINNDFELKLFKTFCNYLSDEGSTFNYANDSRGSFEELYKSSKYGQISENISFANITKGGHYHKYKKEIFYTVKGTCRIRQRNITNNDLLDVIVKGEQPNPVNILPMYTHEITNIGEADSCTIMWISEIYSPETHDTYKEEL